MKIFASFFAVLNCGVNAKCENQLNWAVESFLWVCLQILECLLPAPIRKTQRNSIFCQFFALFNCCINAKYENQLVRGVESFL